LASSELNPQFAVRRLARSVSSQRLSEASPRHKIVRNGKKCGRDNMNAAHRLVSSWCTAEKDRQQP
jgi:hypothetical protein